MNAKKSFSRRPAIAAIFRRLFVVGAVWTAALVTLDHAVHAHIVMQHPGPLGESDIPQFLVQARCIACHDAREARIGPPFIAIAIRYATADDNAKEFLAQKVLYGGAGNWGAMPMVANPQVTAEQARMVVRWILSLRPAQG